MLIKFWQRERERGREREREEREREGGRERGREREREGEYSRETLSAVEYDHPVHGTSGSRHPLNCLAQSQLTHLHLHRFHELATKRDMEVCPGMPVTIVDSYP